MTDLLLIAVGGVLILVGIIGCIIPALPGPPLSYAGLWCLQLSSKQPFSLRFLAIYAAATAVVLILDYVVPLYGTKKLGGSPYGIRGCFAGLVLGMIFFPPLGMVVGPFLGAFAGEMIAGQKAGTAIHSALGSFLGFVAGTVLKLSLAIIMAYHFAVNLF